MWGGGLRPLPVPRTGRGAPGPRVRAAPGPGGGLRGGGRRGRGGRLPQPRAPRTLPGGVVVPIAWARDHADRFCCLQGEGAPRGRGRTCAGSPRRRAPRWVLRLLVRDVLRRRRRRRRRAGRV